MIKVPFFKSIAINALLLCACYVYAQGQHIVINEFMASNARFLADEDGDYEDWIELYNPSSASISLHGWGLSDDPDNPMRWVFPDVEIPAQGFLLVWASGKGRNGHQLHTNFSISSEGETLLLSNANGQEVDFAPAVYLISDISYGRYPDGSSHWFYFDDPSPQQANSNQGKEGILMPPKFSHKSGKYPNAFHVKIEHPDQGVQIRYSTDASLPGLHSALFENPIPVHDRSQEELSLSLTPTSSSWTAPQSHLKKKAFTIRARAYKEGFIPSSVESQVYFVNDNNNFNHLLPIISLITEDQNLINPETGIYVEGNHPNLNFNQRGYEWERPATFHLLDAEGNHQYQNHIGIRIHGGTSRKFPQKGLRLYFRNTYQDEFLYHPIFPNHNIHTFRRLILRPSGQDMFYSFLRDGLMMRLVDDLKIGLQAFEPAVLYINGEYWGIHNIRERLDKYHLESNFRANPDNIDFLHHTNIHIIEGDREHYESMLSFIENNDLQQASHFEALSHWMNIESYTDYKIAEAFFYRWDMGNIRFWRERSPEAQWQWIFFDLDVGYGGFWTIDAPWSFNMLAYLTEDEEAWTGYQGHNHNSPKATFLFRQLLKNQNYREHFVTRFADLLNTNFLPQFAHEQIDSFASLIREEIPNQIARWNMIPSLTQWEEELQYMKTYAEKRPQYQFQQLQDFFALDDPYPLSLNVNNPLRGFIRVNSIPLNSHKTGVGCHPYPWFGKYFKNMPLELEAKPLPGFVFTHWSGDLSSTEPILSLKPEKDLQLKAHFEPSQKKTLITYWLFDTDTPNNLPLSSPKPTVSMHSESKLIFHSCLPDYPYTPGHALWREASMERRNNPTPINYRTEGNDNQAYNAQSLRALQIKPPFVFEDKASEILLILPTVGIKNPILSFVAKAENLQGGIIIEYKTQKEQPWQQHKNQESAIQLNQNYQLIQLDFTELIESHNNPDFQIKITLHPDSHENPQDARYTFNHISLDGHFLNSYSIEAHSKGKGSIKPSGNIGIFEGNQQSFMFKAEENHDLQELWLDGINIIGKTTKTDHHQWEMSIQPQRQSHKLLAVFNFKSSFLDKEGVKIYPNPATDRVNIASAENIKSVSLYNMQGLLLKEESLDTNWATLSLANIKAGIYLLVINWEEKRMSRKLVVQPRK